MMRRLIRSDHAGVNHLLDGGMVMGNTTQLTATELIQPGVAGPDAGAQAIGNEQADHGGSERAATQGFNAMTAEIVIDQQELVFEDFDEIREILVRTQLHQRIHHRLTGDITGRMTTHAVGYRPKSDIRTGQHGIFIDLAFGANVGGLCGCPD